MNWYLTVLRKYGDFSGRARRMEYWMFLLINLLVSLAIAFVENAAGTGRIVGLIYSVAIILPSLAVSVRRLHDTGRSGWWLLLVLIPVLGWLVLLYFYVQDGEGDNTYGPNPKAAAV